MVKASAAVYERSIERCRRGAFMRSSPSIPTRGAAGQWPWGGRIEPVAGGSQGRDAALLRRNGALQRADVAANRGNLSSQAALLAPNRRLAPAHRADLALQRRDFSPQRALLTANGGDFSA